MTKQTRTVLTALALATVPAGVWLMWRHEGYFAVAAWLSGIYISRLARGEEGDEK